MTTSKGSKWPSVRHTITITSEESLGSRADFVRRLGARVGKERLRHAGTWIGNARKTRQKRREVLAAIAYNPEPVPFRAELLREDRLSYATRRHYRLQINPEDTTEAILMLPLGASASNPVPGLIGIHGHGGMFLLGKEKHFDIPDLAPVFQRYQQERCEGQPPGDYFAKHGFAVLTIDQFGFSSRALWHEEDEPYRNLRHVPAKVEQKIRLRMRYEQFWLHRALLAYGISEAGICLYDNRRSVDFLQSLPEIDSKRLGAFGQSMGALQCHHLSAIDPRIKASVRSCWSGDWSDMLDTNGPRSLGVHLLLPELDGQFHVAEWVALSDPNPALIINGKRDPMYPFQAQEKTRRQIQQIARKQGPTDRLLWRYHDGGHQFRAPQQEVALRFFQKFLLGKDIKI